ncbi:MAG: hypothetical protein AMS22_06855 [Thiotrichales bacterium SG8_50]|nr:MAG: hypothetical protein AMS22_06855 [Thiotrichales bacterium SG8_50]
MLAPTPEDNGAKPDAIGANLIVTGNDTAKKMELLECQEPALEQLVILHSRDDYPKLRDRLLHSLDQNLPHQ